ncbi:Polynucleotide 5'-hydroxyl-kinase nol9 [Entophlyctis luteolus]|nr:Polynucleotide 5'-hydroxyl-kinase nol9 [Entophlyctis luteolus]
MHPRLASNPFEALRLVKNKNKPAAAASAAARSDAPHFAPSVPAPANDPPQSPERPAKRLRRTPRSDVLFVPDAQNVVRRGNLAVIAMKPGEILPFHGTILICPLVGVCSVNGFVFKPHSSTSSWLASQIEKPTPTDFRFYPCFSPRSTSFLVIESEPHGSRGRVESLSRSQSEHAASISDALKELYRQLPEKSKQFGTVIALKSFSYCGLNEIQNRLPSYKHLFSPFVPAQARSMQPEICELDGFYPILPHMVQVSFNNRHVKFPNHWYEASDTILDSLLPPVICVIGSKGLGKSTMCRFLVNQLLAKYNSVAFLDCDLGQPELTPTGQVSIHVLEDPLLGPAFTNFKHPLFSCFVGATTPKNDPDFYSACVLQLWDVYKTRISQKIPLVINTDGWVRGMGFDLLLYALKQIRPTHVVQLCVPDNSQFAGARNIKDDLYALLNEKSDEVSEVSLMKVYGHEDAKQTVFLPALMRDLGLLAYFAQRKRNPAEPILASEMLEDCCVWDWSGVAARVPYSVPWHVVRLRFLNIEVPPSQSLVALNGTLVALVVDNLNYAIPANPCDPDSPVSQSCAGLQLIPSDIQTHPRHQNCVGLGIVRAIDPAAKLFYVATPLALDQICEVNLIVRGGAEINFPSSMMIDGFEVKISILHQ